MAARGRVCSAHLGAAASLVAAALLLLSPPAAAAWAGGGAAPRAQSWALGVVVPDGAALADGGQLSWAETRNVTALLRLPNIADPGGVTYLVLSAEGDDGAIIQVAAGVWPGSGTWLAYSWYVTGATTSVSYTWVKNSSAPSMAPGDIVSISVSSGPGAWHFDVYDLNTSGAATAIVPSPALTRFESGDQELVAFESYGRNPATFWGMGNATVLSLSCDGRRVVGGWYAYGGWNPARNPIFAVGGADPPAFISLTWGGDGRIVWSYGARLTGAVRDAGLQPVAFAYAGLAALVPVAFALGKRPGRVKEET